jgi:hypothetical protein
MKSYSPIVATLALFIALGGTATAVTRLPHDSVGAPQIRKDAVRSPEIAKDAVRSPEIAKDAVRSPEIAAGAVRSSELRDGGVELADISTRAQNALKGAQGPPGVAVARIAQKDAVDVPGCTDPRLLACANLVTRSLGAGSWLVEAKLDVGDFGAEALLDRCGLVEGSTVLDTTSFHLDAFGGFTDIEALALSGVVKNTSGTSVSLRCSEGSGEKLTAEGIRITALQVTDIVGP